MVCPLRPAFSGAEIEALYFEHRRILIYVAAVKFRVPGADAEALVHDAMVALLMTRDAIVNVRAWLVAAVCNGSRHYWRQQSQTEPLPRDLEDILSARELVSAVERLDTELIAREALARLRPQERQILYLHYFEQLQVAELARLLGTTPAYAGKLVWKALRRMRRRFLIITSCQRQPAALRTCLGPTSAQSPHVMAETHSRSEVVAECRRMETQQESCVDSSADSV